MPVLATNGGKVNRLSGLIDDYNRTRREAGEPVMTQRRLAELAGVTEATVSRHANGETAMSLAQAVAYARVFGCRVEDLVDDGDRSATTPPVPDRGAA